jgi:PiT family inorganic phosphate transporter
MAETLVAKPAPPPPIPKTAVMDKKLQKSHGTIGMIIFGAILLAGVIYAAMHLFGDLANVHVGSAMPYVLLGLALFIALGFEFVNGFHDTANAVATVIYTHSLEPHIAVAWSGVWNFAGVMVSSGAVAYAIISLLPVELILQVGSGAGFAMVFALLLAAIVWNLGTWWLGLPASSSHTLIGSIIGVGVANQLMNGQNGTTGVDWGQATNVFKALLFSPLVGFAGAALLLLLFKALIKDPRLYEAPKGEEPPPFWIRALLVLTCTGVSFAHGSNDGQKGMGLIMLILIGTVPTAYALNHNLGIHQVEDFVAVSERAAQTLSGFLYTTQSTGEATGATAAPYTLAPGDERGVVTQFIKTRDLTPAVVPATRLLILDIESEVSPYKSLSAVPAAAQTNTRNDMYLASESIRVMMKKGTPAFPASDVAVLTNYRKHLDGATKFIPTWVKVIVAIALGLGTMVGWKRIVVTVGEKIGKEHLTYGQGAAAEIVAMCTIMAADQFGLPVSTTHVLSSGVAGTMMANKSGLQWSTIRNIALAWVFTLPMAALLSGGLFYLLRHLLTKG